MTHLHTNVVGLLSISLVVRQGAIRQDGFINLALITEREIKTSNSATL